MIRRSFLSQLAFLVDTALVSRKGIARVLSGTVQSAGASDREIALKTFAMAARRGLQEDALGEIMVAVGSSFTGTAYAAHALEIPGPERLVVNLRGFDCTTFVESTLALARCVKLRTATFEAFLQQLQAIRYRAGVIKGYPSRLHYFIDWVADNEKKRIVRDVTRELGGLAVTKPIDFMTVHRREYHQLDNEENVSAIAETERRLSEGSHTVVTKQRIAAVQDRLQNGDIVALATTIKGLDVTHMGMAVRSGRIVRLLHAPLMDGTVQFSERALPDYVAALTKASGIIVARPLNP